MMLGACCGLCPQPGLCSGLAPCCASANIGLVAKVEGCAQIVHSHVGGGHVPARRLNHTFSALRHGALAGWIKKTKQKKKAVGMNMKMENGHSSCTILNEHNTCY